MAPHTKMAHTAVYRLAVAGIFRYFFVARKLQPYERTKIEVHVVRLYIR